jgi:hypothetical protein
MTPMRPLLFLILFVCGATAALAQGPPGDPFSKLRFLMGEWVADEPAASGPGAAGSAAPSSGHFEFTSDVQGKVLIRRNHAEYPAVKPRPAVTHDDLMVIYREGEVRATYFDSEGHVIRYTMVAGAPGTVTFVSETAHGTPRFRLSYQKLPDGRLGGKFELAEPDKPEEFKTYLEWTAKRKPS